MKGFSPQEVGLPSQNSGTEDSVQMAVPMGRRTITKDHTQYQFVVLLYELVG
jgi:hypothetical protein